MAQLASTLLLSMTSLGVSMVWSIESAYASPYLISLGLTRSAMSVVLLAGPLSGLIVGPIIGSMSDKCCHSWGRRRPFIVYGCLICILSLLMFGHARSLAALFSADLKLARYIAVVSLWIVDFSVNAIMSADRALMVDQMQTGHDQDVVQRWAARMGSLGSIVGYCIGVLHFGDAPGQQLSGVVNLAATALFLSHIFTVYLIKEIPREHTDETRIEVLETLSTLYQAATTLTTPIKTLFKIQLVAWCAYYPFLFFSTVFIGDFVVKGMKGEIDMANGPARAGSRALFTQACLCFIASILIPLLVINRSEKRTSYVQSITSLFRTPEKRSLEAFWAYSHFAFALAMFGTFFANSTFTASLVIIACGPSWAVACWVPFALLGNEINSNQEFELLTQNEAAPLTIKTGIPKESGAGVILGLHNVCFVIPQILVSTLSSMLFAILEPQSQLPDAKTSNGVITLMMQLGGVASFIAGLMTLKLWQQKAR